MGNYKKLTKNITVVAIGTFSSKLLNFFLVPLYTLTLTTSEYGVVDIMFVTINLLLPLFTGVIFEGLLRYALDPQYDKTKVLTTGIMVNLIGMITFLICSPIILLFDKIKNYYFLFIICFFIRIVYENLTYFTRGIEEIKVYSVSGIINTFLLLILNIIFLFYWELGIYGYMAANAIAYAISIMYIFFAARIYDYLPRSFHIDFSVIKEMLAYSVPMIPNSISWWVSNSSDKYLLTYFHGTTLTGLYSVAYKVPSIINALSSMFDKAWQISAVENFGSENSKKFYKEIYSKYTSFQVLCSSAIILFSHLIAKIMFRREFISAVAFVPILVIAVMFHAFSSFLGTIYTASKHTASLFYSTALGAILNIILNCILIPKYSGYGAAIATLFSYFFVYIYRMIHSKKFLNFKMEYINNLICFMLLGFQTYIHYLNTSTSFIFSSIIFFLLLVLRRKFIVDIVSILKKNVLKIL
jgi:O-antigen/teichoic acid export membrane protein